MSIELALLPSPVRLRDQEITSPRLCALLAALAADLRAGRSTGALVETLWPDERPAHPAKALQILVSRIRSQVGPDTIVRTPSGYRLDLAPDQVDAGAALASAAAAAHAARAGDHAAALSHAEAGLRLWWGDAAEPGPAGPPPGPSPEARIPGPGPAGGPAPGSGDPLADLRSECASTYRELFRARALALARLGRHTEAIRPLTELARDRPRDEEVLCELLLCEAALSGPAAALERYETYRRTLRADLGADPGEELRAVHGRLLAATVPTVRSGVPYEPNRLIGRTDAIADVTALLRTSRVTSIVGPGGLGKTRLAYAVSRRAGQRTVTVVGLAGVTRDEDVAGEVASAVGPGESRSGLRGPVPGSPDLLGGIAAALAPGPALLVLDNCEHVLGGVASLVAALVATTRDLCVLTTSRSALGLSSESVYRLRQLNLVESAELFAARARAARPDAELPDDAVAEVCRHLDGLPLAVELAAARIRVMSVAEIARRLDDRFSLLRGGPRDAPRRHHTLHGVVDWSWNLLEPDRRAAMRALSVFPAGFTADAAALLLDPDAGVSAVSGAAGTPGAGVLAILDDLVCQSLLQVADTPAGTRFMMLETVREFAAEERSATGEDDSATAGFLNWAREFGVTHHEALYGADPFRSVDLIRAEQDNLVQALRYAIPAADNAAVAAVTAVLAGLWAAESAYSRLQALIGETGRPLSHYRPEPRLVEVTRTALTQCTAFTFLIEGPRPVRSLVAARRLPPAPPDTPIRAIAFLLEASVHDPSAVHELCTRPEPHLAGVANAVAGYLWENEGDVKRALRAAERMLEVLQQVDVPWLRSLAHSRISELCLQMESGAEAVRHLRAAMPLAERLGLWSDVAGMRWWMALANLQDGDVDTAEHWLARAPGSAEESTVTLTYGLGARAEILLARGDIDGGLRLWRDIVHRLENADDPAAGTEPGGERDPWALEAKAVAVVAHARHECLDQIREVADELSQVPPEAVVGSSPHPSPFVVEARLVGVLLVALAVVDLASGRRGDRWATTTGVRLIALAERMRYLRSFQPTMASAAIRALAEQADGPAYREAVSSYAGRSPEELRAATLDVLRERARMYRTVFSLPTTDEGQR